MARLSLGLWLGATLLAAPPCARAAAPAADTMFSQFVHPPMAARPWGRWWWPGGAVDDTELKREVALFQQAGYGGLEVQPFKVNLPHLTPDELTRLDDYATPSFFGHLTAALRAARKAGMRIDYTLGSAWPSGGGAAIPPELALGELTMATTELDAPRAGPIKLNLPARSRKMPPAFSRLGRRSADGSFDDWPARADARAKLVAIVAVRGTAPALGPHGFPFYPWYNVRVPGELVPGSALVLTDKWRADGTLDWTPPAGHWQILVFERYLVDQSIGAAAGHGPQLVLDHFNQAAFEAHAHRVGDPLEALPADARAALRATFVDSLELFPDIYWSDDFLAEFRRRRGYDLTPYLPLIVQPGWMEAWSSHYSPPYYDMPDIGDRVRADYRATLSDLMYENFVMPFARWNTAHHLQSRYQAHGTPTDILRSYGAADMPETEDLFGTADTHFLRLARSAADLYGRGLASSESLCWIGHPFDITPAQWRQRADLLFASGVTQIVEHGVPYRLHPEQWPGWHPFGPSGFTPGFSSYFAEENPLWAAVPSLNLYIARLQAVLRPARNDVPVALYYGEVGYYPGIEDAGANAHAPGVALLNAGYDYDRINDDALSRGHVVNGAFVSAGGARFLALVVPPLGGLPVATARRLAEFARQGLVIRFLDHAPQQARGLLDHARLDAEVASLGKAALAHGAAVTDIAGLGATLRQARVPPNLSFEASQALFIEKRLGRRIFYFLHNDGAAARHIVFDTAAVGGVQRWNAMDGTREPFPSTRLPDGQSRITVDLDAGKSAFFVLDPAFPHTGIAGSRLASPLDVAGPWSLHAEGHGLHGRVIDVTLPLASLADWRDLPGLADLAGSGTYASTVRLDPAATGGRILLDLGNLHEVAMVTVNGRALPALIEPPYVVDITTAVHGGDNALRVTVFSTLQNSLLDPRKAGFKALKSRPAGLLGPVRLLTG